MAQIRLADGRLLGYDEYGDPRGEPVFYFHGFPGSRLEAQPVDSVAARLGARIISVDRPGMGLSAFQPGRTMSDWPKDVAAVADGLGLGRIAVLGVSGGGPYAAVCGLHLVDRLAAVGIVCGLAPLEVPNLRRGLSVSNRILYRFCRNAPWLARITFGVLAHMVKKNPESVLASMARSSPPPDRAVLERPEMRAMIINSLREAFREGTAGAVWDGRLFRQPWGFSLEQIPVDVLLWQGELDSNVPAKMGRYQAALFPKCRSHFSETDGHLSLLANRREEILRALLSR